MNDRSYVLIDWMGGEVQSSFLFTVLNDDQAIGFSHGLLVERIDRMGRAYADLGCSYDLRYLDALSAWEVQHGMQPSSEPDHIGNWTVTATSDGFGLEWQYAEPEESDEGAVPEG